MSIYTKRGDTGQTSLLNGESVYKDHRRVDTYGTLDELQSVIGLARALCPAEWIAAILKEIQMDFFVISAELAAPGRKEVINRRIEAEDVKRIEAHIDRIEQAYSVPSGFVVPGDGGADSAALHVSRTVCRRCERLIVALFRSEGGRDVLLSYINRLGDLLFMLGWALQVRLIVKKVLNESIQMREGMLK